MQKTGVFLFILICTVSPLFSLTVTEVMTDPDSQPDYRLEWVELYNNTSSPLTMENWSVNGAPFSMTLEGYSCGVVVRQAEGEDSFASVYGDHNGIWGDAPGEEYPCVEASLSLVNSGGTLKITDSSGKIVLEKDYPADQGETEDNTVRLYSRGTWEYGTTPWGTPGEAHVMVFLDFDDSAVKEGSLFLEEELVQREACTGFWRVAGVEAGLFCRMEVTFHGELLYSRSLLLREDFYEKVDLDLPEPFPMTFRFYDSAGYPLAQAEIIIVGKGKEVFSGMVEDHAPMDIYPGTYEVYAFTEGHPGRYYEITVSEPGEAEISFPHPESVRISEIAPFGAPEWIEIRSLSAGEVTLRGIALGDNTETVPVEAPRGHFRDYLVLTEDKETFTARWGDHLPVMEVPSFPSLNDDGDRITLFLGETVCDRLNYGTDWYSGEQPGSFERIMPREPPEPGNFYATRNPTPGRVNRVDGMLNGERKIILREVSPFTEEEYTECLILDDGTGGRGALFFDYLLTDLDTETHLPKQIFIPGEAFLLRKLSLSSRGDQVCLLLGETVMDAFAWREKYEEMSPDEKEDFVYLNEEGVSPVLFDESDATLSFQYQEGEWVLARATPGIGEGEEREPSLVLPGAVALEEGAISMMYSLDSITEVEIFLFDTAGFRLLREEAFLSGEGELSLDIPRKRGRYIFIADYRRGEEEGRVQQTFVIY